MIKKLCTLLALALCLNGRAQIITTIAGNGTFANTGDGGLATAAEINGSLGIIFDKWGNCYFSTGSSIRKINTLGIISTIAGTGISGYTGDGGQATMADINDVHQITFDFLGNMYITDAGSNVIRKINTSGTINTVAGNGTGAGFGVGAGGYSGDGGQATAAELSFPTGIAVDDTGNIYISDAYNNVVRKVNTSGIISTLVGNGYGAGLGTGGYSGDGGPATAAKLFYPMGITLDPNGNLFIADDINNRIRKVNTAGIISTIIGDGTQGFSGDGGPATLAELNHPYDVIMDAFNNIYISEIGNNCIRKITSSGIINTIAGDGTQGFSGDGGPATLAELNLPCFVALDTIGNLYITDGGNSRVRKVTNATQAGIQIYNTQNTEFSIYPNPNNGLFVIEPQNTLYNVHCTVYDVNGTMVLSQILNGKTSIDASSLSEGVYNISLQSNEGVVNKRVVIVR